MEQTTSQREKVLGLIRDVVIQQMPEADIILYGSRARGDARSDSDWDVLVLTDRPQMSEDERATLDYTLWSKGLDIGEEINVRAYTRERWNSLPPSLFKHNVLTDGIRI